MKKTALCVAALLLVATPLGACHAPWDADASAASGDESGPCDPGTLGRFDVGWDASVDPAALRTALQGIPADTKWADLPAATRDLVKGHAAAMRTYLTTRWGADAVEARSRVLVECPTAQMTQAFDTMVPLIHAEADLPSGFTASRDVRDAGLLAALKKLHVLYFGVMRENSFYREGHPDQDWDGRLFVGTMDGFRPQEPDQAVRFDALGREIRDALRAVPDAGLTAEERALKQAALYRARSYATGSFLSSAGYSNGGEDDAVAPASPWMTYWLLNAYTVEGHVPKTYPSPEAMLEAVNALWLVTPSKWLDVGTTGPGLDFMATGFGVQPENTPLAAEPSLRDVLADFALLRSWSIERIRALPDAQSRCTIFSPDEQNAVWESFSADAFFDSEGATNLSWAVDQTNAHVTSLLAKYRGYAAAAVNAVFPDGSVLSADQRAQVLARIAQEPSLVQLSSRVATILDEVTGSSSASAAFTAAQAAAVGSYGGGYTAGQTARPSDIEALNRMEGSLKGWIKTRYQGYVLNVDDVVNAIAPLKFNTGSNTSGATTPGGLITFGLKDALGAGSVFRTLMQQTLFAVNRVRLRPGYSAVAENGASWIAMEHLIEPFVRDTVADGTTQALILLDAATMAGSTIAITDATLKRLTRKASPGCSDAADQDTLAFTKSIADGWGLSPAQATKLQQRVHAGSQYLVYLVSGVLETDIEQYLDAHVDPSAAHEIDPFVWFACNVPNPQKDDATVEALKVCLQLP